MSFDALLDFDESDLQDIGLAKGPRVKMMKCAAKYPRCNQDQQQVLPPSPAVPTLSSPAATTASAAGRKFPDEFFCPISHECMRDPVIVTATGMTYERDAIVEWLSSHDTDPSTGVELGGARKQLAPNVVLRKLIAAWEEGA